jgi:hypothetical protein
MTTKKPRPPANLELPVKAIPAKATRRHPDFRYREARRIPGYNITRHGCDRCGLPLRATDLVLPTGDMRAWIHAFCETPSESSIVIDVHEV